LYWGGKAEFLLKRQVICGFFEIFGVVLGCGVVIFRLVVFFDAWEWRILLSILAKCEAGGLFWLCALCDGDGDDFSAVVNLGDRFF